MVVLLLASLMLLLAGIPAVAGLPSAVDVCDVSIVSAGAKPAVNNFLQLL